MLKSKTVAKLIETTLNYNENEKFRVEYGAGGHKGSEINCILKQGKGTTTPIANYTNVKTPFSLEIIVPMQGDEDRVDGIVDIVNGLINELNGRVKNIDSGKAVFLFNPLEIGDYETRATVGQSLIIRLEFFVEYSSNTGTKYEMALVTSPFELGTQNVGRFQTFEDQIAWFDALIEKSNAPYHEILNANIGSMVINRQRYLNPRNTDINDLFMNNYAIIKETKWNDDVNYYFYYVTNAGVDEYNIPIFDLKMDTLQTFYNKIEFGDCFISRAHLDRFVENSDGTVSFNTKLDSPLFEREDFKNAEKRLVNRDVVSPFHTGFVDLDNWYNNNIYGWIYMYLAGTPTYKVGDAGYGENNTFNIAFGRLKYTTFLSEQDMGRSVFYNTLSCLAFPVYKTTRRIRLDHENAGHVGRFLLPDTPINQFLYSNRTESGNGTENIYSLKFSIVPPFDIKHITNSNMYSIDEDGHLVIPTSNYKETTGENNGLSHLTTEFFKGATLHRTKNEETRGEFFLSVDTQYNTNMDVLYNYDKKNYTHIYKSYITNLEKRDINLNPKLYNSDYMALKISDNTQNGADYDILKLSASGNVWLRYSEPLTPDISKVYIRCYSDNSDYGAYNIGDISNLTGFVGSDDKSLVYESTAFQSVLANNKNFFLQNTANRGFDVGQGVFGAVMGALQGAFFSGGNPVGAVVGAGVSIAQTAINSAKSKINESLTVDNLKNAPATINGALGNIIFNSLYSELGIVVEKYDIFPFEKQIIDDQMYMNGFTYNKVDNIKNFDNIRKYFNFVQANVENIIGDISTPIREDIRQRFADGVRFWNVYDTSWGAENIDYSKENYERWLEA